MKTKDPVIARVIVAAGGVRSLARALGIKHNSVLTWVRIPAGRIVDIERITGIPREKLRPELYRR